MSAEAPGQVAVFPPVTVIVPTLGERPDLLEVSLRGISSQDYPGKITCLVVLDQRPAGTGSNGAESNGAERLGPSARSDKLEKTRAVVAAAGARIVANERKPGLAGSRNTGILATQDELVAFCDDDDTWLPGKVTAQVAALAAEPAAALVCCGVEVAYGDKITLRIHPQRVVTFEELLRSRLAALHPSTFVARRTALLDDIGLVSEEIPGSQAEDYELLLRAARYGPVLNVPVAGVRVLWHTHRPAMHGSWPMVAVALPWLLDHYPEFRGVPAGYARIAGRTAFAAAASGDRAAAWKWARHAIRASAREPRPYIALAVLSKLITPESVVRVLHNRGHGI